MSAPNHYDVIIVGGGAAGLMCALVAGQRRRRVLVIERANRVGKKILMSGGGRCNFTNTGTTADNFLSANPHFCKSALARYSPQDFVALVERHRIAWHEKELGQLFCDVSSKLIVRMLLDECAFAGVRIETGCAITEVKSTQPQFRINSNRGEMVCGSLVVASGGLSIPSMGASGFGYDLARQFGHSLLPTRAALVPLTLSGKHLDRYRDLSGLSLPVQSRCNGQSFNNQMLITHRGISGPAILQISSYWEPGNDLRIDLLPDIDATSWVQVQQRQRANAQLKSVLAQRLPARFAERVCELSLPSKPMRQYHQAQLTDLARELNHWPIIASGTEGYRTAEVTMGGVDTAEISSTRMESKRMPGLYFIGEVADVTGWLGGYNFQWAWASGQAAGQVV